MLHLGRTSKQPDSQIADNKDLRTTDQQTNRPSRQQNYKQTISPQQPGGPSRGPADIYIGRERERVRTCILIIIPRLIARHLTVVAPCLKALHKHLADVVDV